MNLKKLEFEKLIEQISTLYREKKYSQLKSILADINPTDIAVLFDEFPNEQRILLFRLLPKEEAAETFVELDGETQDALIHAFSDTELREVIDELYLDDTVDIIEEMPATIVKRILRNTDAQTRKSINTLLKYPEDSSRHLIGVTTVKELLLHDYGDKIEEFMETNTIFVNTHDDKEIAANFLDKYNFLALPVVDMENRLVGIITVDDAIDVLQEENTEDIQKMHAIMPNEKPYLKTGIFETWKSRITWLLFLMISATFTGMILNAFEDKLSALIVLTSFVPMLTGTSGNSGGQASAVIIRALSLKEIDFKDIFKVIWKEFRVGVLCGITLAAVNFVKIWFVDRTLLGMSAITIQVDLVISLTLIIEIIFAKMVGCVFPILAKK